jgi:hypothetical protein
MAYTCNLLLRTLPAIEKEAEDNQQIINDLPRPKYDEPDPARAAYENWDAYIAAQQSKAKAPPDPFTAAAHTPEKKL